MRYACDGYDDELAAGKETILRSPHCSAVHPASGRVALSHGSAGIEAVYGSMRTLLLLPLLVAGDCCPGIVPREGWARPERVQEPFVEDCIRQATIVPIERWNPIESDVHWCWDGSHAIAFLALVNVHLSHTEIR